jgi:putative aminopeptidase FrvX
MRWYPSSSTSPLLAGLVLAAAPAPAAAQSVDALAVRFAAMSAVTGLEDAMADSLLRLLPGSARDRAGNVVLVRGTGRAARVAVCPLDEIGYVVGAITAEGYLTLRRVGATPMGPLYDQFLEGQRVTVFGRRGAVPGVVGVRSTHLTRGRPPGADAPFPLDDAYVDVGAATASGAAALGIAVLAPVTRAKAPHRYGAEGGLLSGPWVAQRAACAALAAAALRLPDGGSVVVAFTARRHFNHDGTAFVLAQHADSTSAVLLLGEAAAADPGAGPQPAADSLGAGRARRAVERWSLPARYARTPAETVSLADVAALERRLAEWLGGGR